MYIQINHLNLILPSKMGRNHAEHPFNMGMFYNSRCHSKWVCFQIPNTHIRAFLYWSCPPPPPPPPGDQPTRSVCGAHTEGLPLRLTVQHVSVVWGHLVVQESTRNVICPPRVRRGRTHRGRVSCSTITPFYLSVNATLCNSLGNRTGLIAYRNWSSRVIARSFRIMALFDGSQTTLKKVCFLSSGWPKLWPVGRPQYLLFSSFFFVRKYLKF